MNILNFKFKTFKSKVLTFKAIFKLHTSLPDRKPLKDLQVKRKKIAKEHFFPMNPLSIDRKNEKY